MKTKPKSFAAFRKAAGSAECTGRMTAKSTGVFEKSPSAKKRTLAAQVIIKRVTRFTPLSRQALRVHCNGQRRSEEYESPGKKWYLSPRYQLFFDERKRVCRVEYLKRDSRLHHEINLLLRWSLKSRQLDKGEIYIPGVLAAFRGINNAVVFGQQECGFFDAACAFRRAGASVSGYGLFVNAQTGKAEALACPAACKYESVRGYARALGTFNKTDGNQDMSFPRIFIWAQAWNFQTSIIEKLPAREGIGTLDELNSRAYEYFSRAQRAELLRRYQNVKLPKMSFYKFNVGWDSKKAAAAVLRFQKERNL